MTDQAENACRQIISTGALALITDLKWDGHQAVEFVSHLASAVAVQAVTRVTFKQPGPSYMLPVPKAAALAALSLADFLRISSREGRTLAASQIEALRAILNKLTEIAPKVTGYIEPVPWETLTEAGSVRPAVLRAAESLTADDVPTGEISSSTVERLRSASQLSIDDLVALFEEGATRVQPDELDRALAAAIDTLAQELAKSGAAAGNQLREELGSYIVTGYIAGRRLLGSHRARLEYSRPEVIARNAARILKRQGSLNLIEVVTEAGEGVQRFMRGSALYLGLLGQRSEEVAAVGQVAMLNGLSLAVAEDELFGVGDMSSGVQSGDALLKQCNLCRAVLTQGDWEDHLRSVHNV